MSAGARDSVALVTGAARGLGAAIARALAEAGHPVALVDIDTAGGERVANDVRAAGGRAAVFDADVTDAAAVAALAEHVEAALGPVHVLVLNATGPQPAIEFGELRWDDMLDQLRFFVLSPLLLMQAFVPRMSRDGRVIMIGSDFAWRTAPGVSAYSAAKAAQHSLVRSWSVELASHGVTVNAVAPGWIPVERHADVPAADRAAYLEQIPLGRFGTPDDVAGAVVFLAGPGAGFVTGEVIAVNGGHSFRG
jgi:NAD(P)-dependent dehydrogenase (short-subunit alcohol dehydrogenase family)